MGANNQSSPEFNDETTGIEQGFSRDLIFHLLRNKRRRAVMFYLLFVEDTVTMRALSEQVAAWEHDMTVESLPGSKREPTHVSLYQTHLPTLDEHGIVVFKKNDGVITAGEKLHVFKPYLDAETTETPNNTNTDTDTNTEKTQQLQWLHNEPSIEGTSWRTTALRVLTPPVDKHIKWSRYYLGCAVIGTGLIGGSVLSSPDNGTGLFIASVITLALLTVLSFAHVFYEASPEDVARVEKIVLGKSYRK